MSIVPKKTKLICWIDEELNRRITSAADENDLSKSEAIRQAINAGLEKFFTDSQGEFFKEKIKEVIDESVSGQMDKLIAALEKRIIALLVKNTNFTLQTYSLLDRTLRLEIGFNHDKIKSLTDEKILNLIKTNAEIFENEARGFMRNEYGRKDKNE